MKKKRRSRLHESIQPIQTAPFFFNFHSFTGTNTRITSRDNLKGERLRVFATINQKERKERKRTSTTVHSVQLAPDTRTKKEKRSVVCIFYIEDGTRNVQASISENSGVGARITGAFTAAAPQENARLVCRVPYHVKYVCRHHCSLRVCPSYCNSFIYLCI